MDHSAAPPIRDAATLIVLRRTLPEPAVLMGQRGAGAAFMPAKFVFPGGRVDAEDQGVALAAPLPGPCAAKLERDAPPGRASTFAAAAIRELWEETGLILGQPGAAPQAAREAAPGWQSFFATGHAPAADAMRFVFRAITPPGRPRRFDARFFLVDAAAIRGDPDDFSRADDELSHISWVPLAEARALDLPFITEIVLSEIEARLRAPGIARAVPFFDNRGPRSRFHML
ncbi:MAG: NUDIX hydrolase [Pseudomonadota bacterium]